MANQYKKPEIHVYRKDEVIELLGPAKNQYTPPCDTCDLNLNPVEFSRDKPETLTLQVGIYDCVNFQTITVTIPGADTPLYTLDRADGSVTGSSWSTLLSGVKFADVGSVTVTVELDDGIGNKATCQGSILVTVGDGDT